MCHDGPATGIHPHVHVRPRLDRRRFLRLSALGLGEAALAACNRAASPSAQTAPASASRATATAAPTSPPATLSTSAAAAFGARLKVLADGRYLRVEANGMPTHAMMVGIRSWQQQVPLPQNYTGANAWSIPLVPRLADTPISARKRLYRGAIALAVNGVPIFNALNNRGEDAYVFGELDDWGGHCGRADDYHYHVAPLHLEAEVGPGQPIAFALDGFPVLGLREANGALATGLDDLNGHFDASGNYHYHATTTFPYINGGLRGVVEVRDDQVEPQPRTPAIRPPLPPLPGATVTGFKSAGRNAYTLEYTLNGATHFVNYHFEGSAYTFEFVDATGNTRVETYAQRP